MTVSPIPDDYATVLRDAKSAIQAARTRAVLAVNSQLIELYWTLGRLILDRQQAEGWGTKVIERLSNDLRAEFPGLTGLSTRNLLYMRSLAGAWPDVAVVQQVVAQLPWGHNVTLLDDTMRRRHHAPTVGLLLCSDRNERTVRYALNASTSPMAVAGYRYKELPVAEQAALPDEEQLLDIVARAVSERAEEGRQP